MKVAITGGSGFVGSAIYRKCLERGQEVVLLDRSKPTYNLPDGVSWTHCDVSDEELVKKSMDQEQPDHLYMLAGVLGTTELTFRPAEAARVNVGGVANFMQILAEGKELPPTFLVSKPSAWPNVYTVTKDAAKSFVEYYMSLKNNLVSPIKGLEGVIHKWFNAYGPGQHTHPIRKAVPYFILKALANENLRIHGDGTQTADYIHIDDIANIAVTAMNDFPYTQEREIDVGTGVPIDVNYLAEVIVRLSKSKSRIIRDPMRTGELPGTELVANTVNLNRIMGRGKPGYRYSFRDFEDGMLETIDYYRSITREQKEKALDFYRLTEENEHNLLNYFKSCSLPRENS
jgi:UDP-glucose 4-epimerase